MIEEKIRKLLALASSANEHEALLAATKASELARQHNIDILNLQTPPLLSDEEILDSTKIEQWIINIIQGVALLNCTKCYLERTHSLIRYRLIGRKHNIVITTEISNYLIQTVKRLQKEALKNYSFTKEERLAYRKDFRLIASQRLYQRLKEKHSQLQSTQNALIVLTQEIDEHLSTLKVKQARQVSTNLRSFHGYRDGLAAADNIPLNDQMEHNNHAVLSHQRS